MTVSTATTDRDQTELVARCQAGDVDAFETLYRRHASRIYTLACRMAGSPEDGEDLLQEIFLQAYRKLDSFKGDAAIGTWLYRLALNHCLDYVRGRQAKMKKQTETLDAERAFEPANSGYGCLLGCFALIEVKSDKVGDDFAIGLARKAMASPDQLLAQLAGTMPPTDPTTSAKKPLPDI